MSSRKQFAGTSKLVVLNPLGNPPSIPLVPMAARHPDLTGRKLYFVDVRFMNGDLLLEEMRHVFAERHPGVETIFRRKKGGYAEDDPELWAEIKKNQGLMVMAVGH